MTKQEIGTWLLNTANDALMDAFYYDRKECEDMPLDKYQELYNNNSITKDMIKEAFNTKIEELF